MTTAKKLIKRYVREGGGTTTPSKRDSKICVKLFLHQLVPPYNHDCWVSLVNKSLVSDEGDHYKLLPMGTEEAEWHIKMKTFA